MYDPNLDGNASYDCYPAGGLGGVDPHYSSGPANHFFYLLAEGTTSLTKTCAAGDSKNATGSGSLSGIGRTAAAAIWYRAIRDYMTSSTTYPGARSATLQAATAIWQAFCRCPDDGHSATGEAGEEVVQRCFGGPDIAGAATLLSGS
jgi:Zn-dependent metalloprotease